MLLGADAKCHVIGRKDYGRLGLGQVEGDVIKVTQIRALDKLNVAQIACGESCSFARTKDGNEENLFLLTH